MSCMMLSPAHIATVAHGLAYLLNQSEMCQLSAADELRDALGACRYPHDFLYDDRRIYPVLYRHNEAAYEGRYKAKPDETDEVPAMPDNVPHLLHRLDYNEHYFLDTLHADLRTSESGGLLPPAPSLPEHGHLL